MDSGLRTKRILVTGAAGGIGSATARSLAAEGARVVLHHHTGVERAAALAVELPGSLPLAADLRDETAVNALVARSIAGLGGLDGLVLNHGIWPAEDTPLHEMSLSRWRETMATDLESAFLVCRAFLRHLAESPREEAAIVLVGSTAALFGEAGHADYAAAKAGLTYGLTRTLKNEIVALAPRGRVNAVCPGWTATPMAAGLDQDPSVVDRVTATMAMRKIARPEDVASTITWLLSPTLAGHVSGAIVPVAGGMEGRLLHG
jgi:3-oxoacyl-[acyl-carrier protein] reductase